MTIDFTADESASIDKLVEEHHLVAAGVEKYDARLGQLRQERRLLWAKRSIRDRLAAMTELNRRLLAERGISLDDLQSDMRVTRVHFAKTAPNSR